MKFKLSKINFMQNETTEKSNFTQPFNRFAWYQLEAANEFVNDQFIIIKTFCHQQISLNVCERINWIFLLNAFKLNFDKEEVLHKNWETIKIHSIIIPCFPEIMWISCRFNVGRRLKVHACKSIKKVMASRTKCSQFLLSSSLLSHSQHKSNIKSVSGVSRRLSFCYAQISRQNTLKIFLFLMFLKLCERWIISCCQLTLKIKHHH